jgi:ubiquinone/menaquinone biosynthesis C-methylase UbiE
MDIPASALDNHPQANGDPGGASRAAGMISALGISRPIAGETILEIGCGSGADCLLAAHDVGPDGRVIGVEFTDAAVERARHNAILAGAVQVEFRAGRADAVPVPSGTIDRVITNRVFSLSIDAASVAGELRRVLQPGGRCHLAEALAVGGVPRGDELGTPGPPNGELSEQALRDLLENAGFRDVRVHRWTGHRTATTRMALVTAVKARAPALSDAAG